MSVLQLNALIEYLEGQPELALGRVSRSKEGRSLAKRLWQECAGMLNSISSDCCQKTAEQWRVFYNEYKYRLVKKIKKDKSSRTDTGGGPPICLKLSPLEERLYAILGHDIGEPLPGVRHNPLITEFVSDATSTSHYDGVNVVVEETENYPGFVHLDIQQSISGSLLSREPLDLLRNTFEPAESQLPIQEPQSEPVGSQVEQEQSRQTPPRRLPRRRQQRAESEDQSSARRATETLEALEHESAQAMREHAQATNRLAAAIEGLAERLRHPIIIKLEQSPQRVCRARKRIYITDSDSD